jgi:hypothetical protein
MFMDELSPLLSQLARQPLAFLGGFMSGALGLNLHQDPVKSWLDKQSGHAASGANSSVRANPQGPQSISID